MARRREVVIGQRYQTTDGTAVWVVTELANDAEGISHARLTRVGDATAAKTLSLSALRDPKLFKLLDEPA